MFSFQVVGSVIMELGNVSSVVGRYGMGVIVSKKVDKAILRASFFIAPERPNDRYSHYMVPMSRAAMLFRLFFERYI